MGETTTRERSDIIATLAMAGLVGVIVVVASAFRWLETFTASGIAAGVPFEGVPAELVPAEGVPATVVRVTEGTVVAGSVNPVSAVSLATSIILATLAWLAVLTLFAVLGLRFLRGRFFDRSNPRLLDAAGWTMLGGAIAIYFLETFGRNGVLAAAGLGDFSPSSWAVAREFIPIWIGATVLGLISLAFRRGIRLQRDTEGLV